MTVRQKNTWQTYAIFYLPKLTEFPTQVDEEEEESSDDSSAEVGVHLVPFQVVAIFKLVFNLQGKEGT